MLKTKEKKMQDRRESLTGLKKYRAEMLQKNRAAILDSAIELFLEKGYDQTSLDEISRRAGVSSATLYKHFPTKAELFGGIMSRLWENEAGTENLFPDAENVECVLLAIGNDYAALLNRPQTVALFRVIIAEVPRFPELGEELYERGKKPYLDRLQDFLQRETETGKLQVEDIALAVRQFLGMINDLVFWPQLLVPELRPEPKDIAETVKAAVRTFLAAHGK